MGLLQREVRFRQSVRRVGAPARVRVERRARAVRRRAATDGGVRHGDGCRSAAPGTGEGRFQRRPVPSGLESARHSSIITFGLGSSGSNVSNTNFTFDNRLGETDHDWLTSATETITWLRGRHSFKTGAYVEYMRNNEARGGLWMGQFNFSRNTSNPLDTNYAFSNLLLGVFGQYDETNAYRSTRNRHWQAEWYAQDTWRPQSRLTVDYGARFLWYTPYWQANQRTAAFVPERYDPAKAPRLYYPTKINGVNRA